MFFLIVVDQHDVTFVKSEQRGVRNLPVVMPPVALKVKWLKNKYDVQVDLDEPADRFKAQLFALTGVPRDRQKITGGAKQITDGTDLKTMGLKDGQVRVAHGRYRLPKP